MPVRAQPLEEIHAFIIINLGQSEILFVLVDSDSNFINLKNLSISIDLRKSLSTDVDL